MASDSELLLTAILEEYTALRAEVTKLVDRQYPIVYWGISSVAVIVAVMVNGWENLTKRPLILLFLFFFILPAFVTGYVITWSHIILKIASLGSYLYLVERKIASVCMRAQPSRLDTVMEMPVAWEHRLWETGGHHFLLRSYRTVKWLLAGILLLANALGTGLAIHYFRRGFGFNGISVLVLGSIAFFYALWVLVWFKLFRHISTAIDTADLETRSFLSSPSI